MFAYNTYQKNRPKKRNKEKGEYKYLRFKLFKCEKKYDWRLTGDKPPKATSTYPLRISFDNGYFSIFSCENYLESTE